MNPRRRRINRQRRKERRRPTTSWSDVEIKLAGKVYNLMIWLRYKGKTFAGVQP